MRIAFSERELDVMTVLWDAGPAPVAQVRAGLAERGIVVTHNTVLTILRILEDKGRVAREAAGRAHVYRAVVAREDAGTSALARLIDTVFGGSAARLLAHLARDPRLTHDEVRRLRRLLDDRLGAPDPSGSSPSGSSPSVSKPSAHAAEPGPADYSTNGGAA